MTEQINKYFEEKSAITNKILNYFISKGVKTKFEIRGDEEDCMEKVAIQINLYVDGINDFALFYDFEDDVIDFCSIYEFLTPITMESYEAIEKDFQQDKGIFEDLLAVTQHIESGIIPEVHAFTRAYIKDFTDEYLDKIYDFLMNKNEFFKNLALVSEKFNYKKQDNEEGETK